MEDPLLQISFHDPRWLASFPLNQASILDYFSLSAGAQGFYDKSANNETLLAQNIHDPREQQEHLRQLTGLEYIVSEAKEQEGFYVICKQMRRGPEEVIPLAYYYCLHGIIYMTPPVSAVLTARVRNAIHQLTASFEEVRKRVRFTLTAGYSYNLADTDDKTASAAAESNAVPSISGLDDNVVKRAFGFLASKYPPPGGAPPSQLLPPAPSPSDLLPKQPLNGSMSSPAPVGVASPVGPTISIVVPSPAPAVATPVAATLAPTPTLLSASASQSSLGGSASSISASAALNAQQAAAAAALAASQTEPAKQRGKRKQASENGDDDGKKKRRGKKADK